MSVFHLLIGGFSISTATSFSLFFVVLHLLFKYFKDRSKYSEVLDRIPGPRALPFIGNALDIEPGYEGTLRTMQMKWPKEYGDIFHWFSGSQLNVSICSPELIEVVLTSQKILDKGTDYNWYRDWLGDGLLVSTGEKWKPRRRLLTPAFHFQILDDFVEVFNKQSKVLVGLINEKVLGSSDDEIDFYPLLTRCTLDVICEAAMGVEVGAQLDEECQYARDVARMTQIISERTTKPWLANDYLFPLTPTGREQKRLLNRIHSFTDNIIQKRKLHAPGGDDGNTRTKKKSLLDLMLSVASEKTNQLTDEDLRHEIDTFAFGGHDTTSSALLWLLYCLASNPECQERAFQEIGQVIGNSATAANEFIGMDELTHMKYLECCIKESLRLYPSAPLIERYCNEDFLLGDNAIPAGSNILILIYAVHRNEKHWSDPEVFNPERFLDVDRKRHPFAYIPFSAGSRNCIGQRFALIEEKVIAAWLLKRFRFELLPKNTVVASYQVVLKPLNGLKLAVKKR